MALSLTLALMNRGTTGTGLGRSLLEGPPPASAPGPATPAPAAPPAAPQGPAVPTN
jgi:hypothetical protein